MWKVASISGVILGVASGCSSASSTETLPAGQVDADGPMKVVPPSGGTAKKLPSPPPSDTGQLPGCPSSRSDATVAPMGAADVRARLPGVYRSCTGETGIELRVDPDHETRLVWYALDPRFVRIDGTVATTGWVDVTECEDASCTVEWYTGGIGQKVAPMRKLTIWSEPMAIFVENISGDGGTWSEWLRVAD